MDHIDRIKSNAGRDLNTILNDFLGEFSAPEILNGTYVGEITDNNDPIKLGRCRIRVFGIFGNDIPDDKLPWALPEFTFIGGTRGSFIVPEIGTLVNVYFDRGEIYLPHYTTKILNTRQLPTSKDVDYPNTMVFFETDNGDSFEINRVQQTSKYTHSSGTSIHISKDGSVTIDSVGSITTDHDDLLTVNGSTVTPTGVGPLCAIPICPFSGMLHTGTVCKSIYSQPNPDAIQPGMRGFVPPTV